MQNLTVSLGYKTYAINGDESATIRVKTTDFSVIDRLTKVKQHIGTLVEDLKALGDNDAPEAYLEAIAAADRKVKAELDEVFDSPVSAALFGRMNCLSFAGGQPVALNFLEAILPEIRKDLEAEHSAADKKLAAYAQAAKAYT